MSGQNFSRIIYPAIGILLIVLAWQAYVVAFKVPMVVMPPPTRVFDSIAADWRLLLVESWTTLVESVCGFALAVIVGVGIAVVVTASRSLNLTFYPILIATQSIPKVAIAPLVLVWFGIGIESKIAIAFIVAFFPMVVDTATGLRATSEELLDLAHSLKCTRWQIFWKIQMPSALPFIFSGSKVAVTLAVIGAVIGEFVGSDSGLGNLVLSANAQVNLPLVWAALVFLSVLGMMLYAAIVIAERIVMPWVEREGH